MDKRKKHCQHGLSPVYMQGCPQCVDTAMTALHVCQDNGFTGRELFTLLHVVFPTSESFATALAEARKKIADHDAKKEPQ